MESEFRNIHCYGNGSPESEQATLVLASQPEGDANNNLHFDKVYVLHPNYKGVEIGTLNGGRHPRLIFFTQSFFHGWLPTAAPYDLFCINASATTRGVIVSDSRFTQAGERCSLVHVKTGGVRISNCILGGGTGEAAVVAQPGTEVSVTGTTMQERQNSRRSLSAHAADVRFVDNQVEGSGQCVELHSVTSAIVANNRFSSDPRQPAIRLDKSGSDESGSILIHGNIFPHACSEAAVKSCSSGGDRPTVHGNLYVRKP